MLLDGACVGEGKVCLSVLALRLHLSWTHTHLCEQASSTADIQYFQPSEWFPRVTLGVHIQQIIPE